MDFITGLDGNILLWIQENLRMDAWDPVVVFITRLGNGGAIWIIASVCMLFFPRSRKMGLLVLSALLASLIVNNWILKNLAARSRPWVDVEGLKILISKPTDYSFPSGHTASSFAAAVVVCKNVQKEYRWLGAAALALAFGIGLSRLYIGVHYPTDVLFGALSGTLIAQMLCYFVKRKR